MERTRPHSPEVTVCGSPARVHGFSWIMRGYTISIMAMVESRGVYSFRYDEIGIGVRPILLPARSGMTPSVLSYKDSFTCINTSSLISVIVIKVNFLRANQTVLSKHKGHALQIENYFSTYVKCVI